MSGLAGWLKGALWLFMLGHLVNILLAGLIAWAFFMWTTVGGIENQRVALVATLSGTAAQALPFVQVPIFIVCIFLYLRFVYRGAKNLQLSRANGLSVTPGWAVGWSFVPFANLGMVFSVMKQIWQASADPVKNNISAPATLGWWWGLWLVGGLVTRASEYLMPADPGEDPTTFLDQYLLGLVLAAVASIMAIVSTVLLMSIVRQITAAQEALRASAVFED